MSAADAAAAEEPATGEGDCHIFVLPCSLGCCIDRKVRQMHAAEALLNQQPQPMIGSTEQHVKLQFSSPFSKPDVVLQKTCHNSAFCMCAAS